MTDQYQPIPYQPEIYAPEIMLQRAREMYAELRLRRSVRMFSDKPVPEALIELFIRTAGTAPSGANKQPWTFCVVRDPAIKRAIRIAAEAEEKKSYQGRMPDTWLQDLAHLGTDWEKPYLEIAPVLIIVCKRNYEVYGDEKRNNYYVTESVGIATGLLIAAIHHAGLVTLTHTPSPMQFLKRILNRPENESPCMLLPVGYAASDATVPQITKKSLEEIAMFY